MVWFESNEIFIFYQSREYVCVCIRSVLLWTIRKSHTGNCLIEISVCFCLHATTEISYNKLNTVSHTQLSHHHPSPVCSSPIPQSHNSFYPLSPSPYSSPPISPQIHPSLYISLHRFFPCLTPFVYFVPLAFATISPITYIHLSLAKLCPRPTSLCQVLPHWHKSLPLNGTKNYIRKSPLKRCPTTNGAMQQQT